MAHSRPTLSSPSHPLPLSFSFPSYPLPLLPPTHPLLLPPFHSFTCPDPLFYVLVLKRPLTVLVAITNCQAKYHNVIFCFVRILKCSRPCTARWINYHLLRFVGSWLDTFILETSFSYSLNRYTVEYPLTATPPQRPPFFCPSGRFRHSLFHSFKPLHNSPRETRCPRG